MCLTTRQYGYEERVKHCDWQIKMVVKHTEQLMEMIFDWKEIFDDKNWVHINKSLKLLWEHHKDWIENGGLESVETHAFADCVEQTEKNIVRVKQLYLAFKREYEFMIFCRKRNITWRENPRAASLSHTFMEIDEELEWEELYDDDWRMFRHSLSKAIAKNGLRFMKYDF